MKATYSAPLLLALTLLTGACACHHRHCANSTACQTEQKEIVQKDGLVVNATAKIDGQATWILRSMKTKRVSYAKEQEPATLHFNPEAGLISGCAGVNRFNANYTITPAADSSRGTLSLGPLMSTKMAGPNDFMVLENTYMSLLDKADSYQVDAYELRLFQGNTLLLLFEKDPAQREGQN